MDRARASRFGSTCAGHVLLGKLIAPLARRQAAKQVPKDQARLKELLERGA
jgi:hypothetical protein